ncbi:ABC transporter ATP-binding protein [Enterococcus rivorum]|uniref:ABC transporter domain-containing protein n=1 Tax=Enterococcus rivorum TaxID=762845 RepID=A0A1E5KU07_9ENTE|nr:energy-coupling factor transporter ATPase [Enterococcus rivorum]MBP2100623.1 energy-coupling factor transport system ATP-binding protein [Enterococcus rivorum]OEH81377.1 hypothetical protein BCR26_16650 [Enterococcus rivorum]
MDYLEIKNLTFQYAGSEKEVLKSISLTISKGEFVLICGTSGSGKSTFLKMLKPQLTPAGKKEGTIFLGTERLELLSEEFSTSRIGYVMQNPENQIITETVWHELAFGLENMGIPPTQIKSRIAEMVNFLGIQELVEEKTNELSGGQKQLVNLASVLVMRPEILILDEPTTQLDPIASQNFVEILVRLNREMGMTILLAEHALEATFSIADKVILLDAGQLVLAEQPKRISDNLKSRNLILERFILSLPSATQIYHRLGLPGDCPLTVTEGKRYLNQYFTKKLLNKVDNEKKEHFTPKLKLPVAVKMENCWFRYEKNGTDILQGVNLEINQGEIFSLVGGNGTGKTTLLKTIAGIFNCYHGKMMIHGKPLKKNQHLVGYLPQSPQLVFIKDSVMEDYLNYLQNNKYPEHQQQERIATVAKALDIESILSQHPFDLSGGECQRAALGKVLLTDPKVLLLDEPTKGIDNYGKKQLIHLLKNLAQQGKTILVVTHDLDFAAELSDRCGLFFQNNLLTEDEPQPFFSNHAFYTTAASRISREYFSSLVTVNQVVAACVNERNEAGNNG